MTFDAREQSTHGGSPWEAFWFASVPFNFCHTSGQLPRVIAGRTYTPEAIKCSEIGQNQELGSGTLTLEIPLDCELAEYLKGYLPARPVSGVIYHGHDDEVEQVVSYTGVVASAVREDVCTVTIVPEQEALKEEVPAASLQRQCIRRLYSQRCSVDRSARRVAATLSSVSGRTIRSAAFAAFADGYFAGGWIDAGALMSISSHVGDTLTLYFPLPGLVDGAEVLAYPGCDGTEATCAGKFDNLVNHLGWANRPGINPFAAGGIK